MPVLAQGPRAGPPWVDGALPCCASTVPEGPALQENCPVCPAAASLQHTITLLHIQNILTEEDFSRTIQQTQPNQAKQASAGSIASIFLWRVHDDQ